MPGHGGRGTPAPLHRLAKALHSLEELTKPALGRGDHIPVGRHRSHARQEDPEVNCTDEPLVPDATGEAAVQSTYWKRQLRRRLDEVEKLASYIEGDVTGIDIAKAERWRCKCGAYGRATGQFCDRCGAPRDAKIGA